MLVKPTVVHRFVLSLRAAYQRPLTRETCSPIHSTLEVPHTDVTLLVFYSKFSLPFAA